MFDHDNIQSLFSAIRIRHVKRYLLAKGWRLRQNLGAEAIAIEGPLSSEDQHYEVVLPASENFRGFRDRVQRLVFNVSCIEEREPIEVARDMMSSAALADTLEEPLVSTHFRVRNDHLRPLRLQLDASDIVHLVEAGEAVDILVQGPRGAAPELMHGPEGIVITCRGGSVRLFHMSKG